MMAYYSDNKTEHAFKTFASDLRNGFDYPVVYMYGPEEYLIDWAANTVAGKYVSKSFAAADLEKPDAESVTMEDIVSSCETVSMFSEKRVVWIRDFAPLWQDNAKGFGDSQLKVLEEYIDAPNPGTVLIFSTSKVKNDPKDKKEKKTKLNKLLLSKARCYDFCQLDRPALRAFIEKRVRSKGLTVDRSITDYIVDMTGYYHKDTDYRLMNLDTDLNKMVSLASEKIRREDVDRAILGDMDTYIFDFLDHLSMNHKEDAFVLLHNIIASGSEFFSILGVIISQFELITEVSELRDLGMDISGIVREMGIHEFRVKKALKAAERLGTDKLKKVLCQLYSIDTDVKSGNIDGITALELLIGRM